MHTTLSAAAAVDLLSAGAATRGALSTLDQAVNVAAGFVIKPLYMILTLLLVIYLGRAQQGERDLKLLRISMIAFLIGETFCAINFAPAIGDRALIELLHSLGMVVMGVYLCWGTFELIDSRILNYADPEKRCAIQRFCGHCYKKHPVSCGLNQIFRFAAPALAIIALIPFSSPLRPMRLVFDVFGSEVVFHYYPLVLIAEFRVYPVAAAALFFIAGLLLWRGPKSVRRAELPFFWAMGLMAYSLLRYFLFEAYTDNPTWAVFWEEFTELLTVSGLALFLYVFRHRLGLTARGGADSAQKARPSET